MAREQAGDRILVISDPSISGDMYSSHVDYKKNLDLLHEVFPEACVIYFVRRQSDWLQSAYRQSLLKGKTVSIERFLNFYEGRFHERVGRRVYGARTVNALTLRFLDIYRDYAARFGPDRVYLFRQEDLRRRPQAVYDRLAGVLGLERLPEWPSTVSSNRAFSALAIRLFFFGHDRKPRQPPAKAANVPAHGRFHRLAAVARRLRTVFIKHAFDRLIYVDWDLLSAHGMRAQLDAHYAHDEAILSAVAERILDNGAGEHAAAVVPSKDSDAAYTDCC